MTFEPEPVDPLTLPVRCAPWSREHDADPIGSAGVYNTVVLVEWPLPWPRDAAEIDQLSGIGADGRTRILLIAPEPPIERTLVTVWRRDDRRRFVGSDHWLDPAELSQGLSELVRGGGETEQPAQAAPPELLICGHGQRDRCCGSLGVRLLTACRDRWPGVRVRRCSHTGGHRFAPTGATFPDGRMWAYLDVPLLDAVLGGCGDLRRVLAHYRGSMAFDPVVQAAERAAFEAMGWSWTDNAVTSTQTYPRGDETEVRLTWTGPRGDGSAVANVGLGRSLPVPDCGAAITLAKKSSQELTVPSFQLEA